MKGAKIQSEQALNRLKEIMQRSSQNSLMLYSQKSDYVFDLTYACNEATEQYKEFQKQIAPFKEYVNRSASDIARYDSLIDVLSKMPVRQLSPQAKCDRDVCLALAVNIRRMLVDNNEALKENMIFYPGKVHFHDRPIWKKSGYQWDCGFMVIAGFHGTQCHGAADGERLYGFVHHISFADSQAPIEQTAHMGERCRA